MCDCKKTEGFQQKLDHAKKLTAETGETHVVYVHKAVAQVFIRKETDLNDALGICCYFLADGTEVDYIPTVKQEIQPKAKTKKAKTDVKNIEVVLSEETI